MPEGLLSKARAVRFTYVGFGPRSPNVSTRSLYSFTSSDTDRPVASAGVNEAASNTGGAASSRRISPAFSEFGRDPWAQRGVLFLDELGEAPVRLLDSLRHPLV